jgi:hypothetical protein
MGHNFGKSESNFGLSDILIAGCNPSKGEQQDA